MPHANFAASYYSIGEPYQSTIGSLDSWLTDRYCLYAADRAGRLYRGDINHAPWPLQPAEAEVQRNTLGDWLGIEMPGPPQTLHFAKSLAVLAWIAINVPDFRKFLTVRLADVEHVRGPEPDSG